MWRGHGQKGTHLTAGGNLSWYSHYGKLKGELLYDQATPVLGIYPDKILIQKDTCIPMFKAALFIVAKTWKQPKCLSTDEWIKSM